VNQNLLPGTIGAAQCAVLLIALVVAPIHAQAAPLTERIRATSPDGKFAMRITYDAEVNDQMIKAEMADAGRIFSQTIKAIELVSLPDKSVVANFLADQPSALNTTSSCWCGRPTRNGAPSMPRLHASDTRRLINNAAKSLFR
jgi:hypothetical protein